MQLGTHVQADMKDSACQAYLADYKGMEPYLL